MDYARDFLEVIGRIGIYHSPVHFSATYASATALSLAGAGLPTITDASQILGVVEFPAPISATGPARPRTYWAADHVTSYAVPTLTVLGAAFAATSKFTVLISGDTDVTLTVPSDGLEVRGNTADRAELEGGAPVLAAGRSYTGAYASLTMVSAGANNDIDFVARAAGVGGNSITVAFTQAATALTVSVVGNAIVVTGDIAGGITANAVIAALRASAPAMALVSCMNTLANDGSGNIDAIVATALAGGLAGERAYVPHVDSDGYTYEKSAADIKTAVQLLDDAVATYGAAIVAKGLAMAFKAAAGIPAAAGDGQAVAPWAGLRGDQAVFLTMGLDHTLDSVANRETPASGFLHGTRDCTAANTAYPLAASSTPCFAVLMCAREANAGICITGGSTITTAGGPVPKISVGCIGLLFVDDLVKVYVASSNAGDDVDFVYLTR